MNDKKILYANEIDNKELLNKLEMQDDDGFICIWDTDTVNYDETTIESIIRAGCLSFISIGKNADNLHNLVDSIVDSMQIYEKSDFDVDTRGGSRTNYTLEYAIWEAENNMFEDIDSHTNYIIVVSRKHLKKRETGSKL